MEELRNGNLTSYNGDAPYIFISYSHKDAKTVFPALAAMQERGFRIWFDQGIEAGTEWANNIAAHLRDCSAFVAFVSHNSVKSENCLDEIAYAKSHHKPSLMIFLEDGVVLPEGTEMQTARFQRMLYFRQTSVDGFADQLRDAPLLAECRGEAVPHKKTAQSAPVTQQHESKNRLPLIIGGVIAAVAIIVLLIILLAGGDDQPETESTTQPTQQSSQDVAEDPTETDAPSSDTLPMPTELSENLNDYTFKLGGAVMQLPCTFETLTSNGWTISTSSCNSQSLVAGLSTHSFDMTKDGSSIDVGVLNPSGHATPISECLVYEISVYAKYASVLELSGGIHPDSDEAAITAAFGMPNERNDTSSSSKLYYYSGDSGISCTLFSIDSSSPDYSAIKLRNKIDPFNTVTETIDTVPDFLLEYQAPTELGDDPTTGVVQFEGDLYQLPGPFKALLDNGWTLTTNPGGIPAGAKQNVQITRDGLTLAVTVNNFAEYQTIAENCVISEIFISHYDWDKKVPAELLLPGGIQLGLTRAELEALIPDTIKCDDYSTNSYFTYNESSPRKFSLSLIVDADDDRLYSIRIACESWNYAAE